MTAKRQEFLKQNPTVFVAFGATGDLMRQKLLPSLFRMHRKKLLPPLFHVVGFSRRDWSSDDFRDYVRGILKQTAGSAAEKASFSRMLSYVQGSFESRGGYDNLAKILGRQDGEWRTCANKLFYLAVPPSYYPDITKHLAASGLTTPCGPDEGWTRVIVEKPFGKDAKTAEALDRMLGKLFREEQIYRIDHYLGKETVQNILAFRFSNSFFEPAWHKEAIERIDIRLFESIGVGTRGDFYDSVGALRDVGQNHLLQLLALFAMENPGAFGAEAVRAKREEALKSLRIFSRGEVALHTARGQYKGYARESGVKRGSKTETYFKIRAFLDAPRWQGVPIYLEAGKKLGEAKVEVVVTFRHPSPCLCPKANEGVHYQNTLRYEVQPHEQIKASFWVKKPGTKMVVEEKDFSFDYRQAYPDGEFLEAYERLLLAAIEGDQTLFVSTEEIMASWRFIDPITAAWEKNAAPLGRYAPGALPENYLGTETSAGNVRKSLRREIIFIGLGKMGLNMATRLIERGWKVRGVDPSLEARAEAARRGVETFADAAEAIQAAPKPRLVWLMVASNKVDEVLFGKSGIAALLARGDTLIDGGNSFYKDTMRRAKRLEAAGVRFLDAGVSGGPSGARNGACIMVGGEEKAYARLESLFRDLAAPSAYARVGEAGAGHFVKMAHNGIEYGMMQAIAEGFAVMQKSKFKPTLGRIADLFNHRSVIESRLVGWLASAYEMFGEDLKGASGSVRQTGEGKWTAETAKELKIPAPVIEASVKFRSQSEKRPSYAGKILSALRNQFGGHKVKEE